ncbi:hypothetical protein AVEN_67064-1 [Araneus ventricosus]|uniref:Uncharacterized protein n=1 Tax=Araneus ventricosus TaxID=182803 RepID=A0A4Y2U8H7_ARAVE|nr:hypothetical protein AVEN_67064-1 [Araneus ventricosus]
MEIRLTARTAISFFKTELIDGSGLRASVSAEKWATSLDAKVRIHDLRRNRDSDQISCFPSFSPIRRVRVARIYYSVPYQYLSRFLDIGSTDSTSLHI